MSSLYLVKSEYQVSDGYTDIALLKRDPWHPDYYAVFELKYLKNTDASPTRIDQEKGMEGNNSVGISPHRSCQQFRI